MYVSPNDPTCGGNSPCFVTIQEAVDAPYAVHTIKLVQATYARSFTVNESMDIILEGGWNTVFTAQTPHTTIIKSPSIQSGAVTFRNLTIVP